MRESFLPILCLVLVAMIVVPIPHALLDFLLVANLLSAVVLLGNALFVREPMKLSSLPAMLLLATLFRLSLNISTTRLILSQGHAGEVVEAFGTYAVAGNLIVGLVVFLVLTLVQFIVVAKGAERVAEVAARFALDALPGKQMSIDAELRSGAIDAVTAKKRREDLQLESRFFGALDGSMKFVKGDAIAGLVITAINLVGGLLVGLMVQRLDISAAAQTYSLLTIGDGLLTQIPSLLNSLAAGFVVTRVNSSQDAALAREVLSQIGHIHQVRKIAALAAIALSFVPGLPTIPFLITGVVLLLVSYRSADPVLPEQQADQVEIFQPTIPPLISVRIMREDFLRLGEPQLAPVLFEPVKRVIFERWGLILRECLLELGVGHPERAVVCVRGVAVASVVMSGDPQEVLERLRREIISRVTQSKAELIDDVTTQRTLDSLESVYSDPIAALNRQQISVTQVTEVLRGLLAEDVSIRSLDRITQAVVEHSARAGNPRRLLEEVRVYLGRIISSQVAAPDGTISVYALDPLLDLALVEHENGSSVLAPEVSQAILQTATKVAPGAILMSCSRRSRGLLREVVSLKRKDLTIIAHDEIVEGYQLHVVETITVESNTDRERVAEQLAAA